MVPDHRAHHRAAPNGQVTALPRAEPSASIERIPVDVGSAFLSTAIEQLPLLTILISEHAALADDDRFARFIDDAAAGLGRILDVASTPTGRPAGYLLARGYVGALDALVLLQQVLGLDRVRPVESAEYVRALAHQLAARAN